MKQEYLELYLEKTKQFNFKPGDVTKEEEQREIMRYLMVNGWIPFNAENVAEATKEEFYIDFEHLPKELASQVKKGAKDTRDDWEYGEDEDMDHIADIDWWVDGVWVKDGKITNAKVTLKRKVYVWEEYYTPDRQITV